MKLLLEKSPIDIEQYSEDISSKWTDFFNEIHEHGKEKEFNKFAKMCFEDDTVTIDQFNKWLDEEEDLIRDSIGLSYLEDDEGDDDGYDEYYDEEDQDEEDEEDY